jgi:hypothetical protein
MSKSLSELKSMIEANDAKIRQLQSLHQMADRADTSVGDFESAQRRADQALQPHGRRAGPPMLGEPVQAYRRRLAGEVQKHAPK